MSMIKLSFKTLLAVLILMQGSVQAQPAMWEAGRLDYINGHAEVAAFVNAAGNTQLQVVLCSKNEPQNYRVTLLLPKVFDVSQIFEVKIECDSLKTDAFAELNGNSLEFQLDSNVYTSLPDTPNFTITFNKEDAQYLEIPEVIDIPMVGAAQVLSRVASECTVLCLNDDFSCRKALVSSVLWPRGGFSDESKAAATHLCTKKTEDGYVAVSIQDGEVSESNTTKEDIVKAASSFAQGFILSKQTFDSMLNMFFSDKEPEFYINSNDKVTIQGEASMNTGVDISIDAYMQIRFDEFGMLTYLNMNNGSFETTSDEEDGINYIKINFSMKYEGSSNCDIEHIEVTE